VHFCRPLIDFSSDDVQDYLSCIPSDDIKGLISRSSKVHRVFNFSTFKIAFVFSGKGGKYISLFLQRKVKIDSIERQCDEFIVELQRDYPSTVSTLVCFYFSF